MILICPRNLSLNSHDTKEIGWLMRADVLSMRTYIFAFDRPIPVEERGQRRGASTFGKYIATEA